MTDGKDIKEEKKPESLSRPGRLELKKTVETGQVRQSFSHGRSRSVTVEVKRKRTYAAGEGGHMAEIKVAPRQSDAAKAAESLLESVSANQNLTSEEKAARTRALETARQREAEPTVEGVFGKRPELTPPPSADEAAADEESAASGVAAAGVAASDVKGAAETTAEDAAETTAKTKKPKAVAEAAEIVVDPAVPDPSPEIAKTPETRHKKRHDEKEEKAPAKKGKEARHKQAASLHKPSDQRRRASGKLTMSQALDDSGDRTRSLAAMRRAREREREKQRAKEVSGDSGKKIIRDVVVPESITIVDLANRMAERVADVVKTLMQMGVMATINDTIDADTAELVIAEFGHKIRRVSEADVEIGLKADKGDTSKLLPRAPVVTVMGHVDHGKTSLLDALRATDVVAGEAGGITQHIGAYQVTLSSGAQITFLDTPGHEAFTAMRARGADVTDLVILVVAADDGIKAQTLEAISHAQAAGVPMIIAINKIDVPGADPNRVRTELLQHNIVVEQMGGDVLDVEVSAKEKTNLDKLEEAIILQAEILELKASAEGNAEGTVVESRVEKGRGPVATVLVSRGTLKVGDIFVSGSKWGKVRALLNDHGKRITDAGPSVPVEVLGLTGTPDAGDDFIVVESEGRAREVTEYRERQKSAASAAAGARGTIEQMMSSAAADEIHTVPVVIKADVQGSVEALVASLDKLGTDEVKVRMLHSGVGGINESDVTLANASGGVIVGFNVRANPQARDMARRDKVEIRYYSIIYDAINDLKAAMSGMLAPTLKEQFLGNVEIREVFSISKVGKVAGCMVTEGTVKRGAKVRLLRDNVVVHEGELSSLKRFKDEVKEVKEGFECGLTLANYQDMQVGDIVECFELEEIAREL